MWLPSRIHATSGRGEQKSFFGAAGSRERPTTQQQQQQPAVVVLYHHCAAVLGHAVIIARPQHAAAQQWRMCVNFSLISMRRFFF